ncbi:hypothetical protein ALC57_12517 [Trachymyrmex cornetzi]|uniref:Uncharacterized protein n=1 Tax=Trachymyrmex cornetzi TaxID=471704 RepID=A0A151J105_9HYME|nr:hypothetical protein ALC57_12517 [Trachymyrmex cornetzi]
MQAGLEDNKEVVPLKEAAAERYLINLVRYLLESVGHLHAHNQMLEEENQESYTAFTSTYNHIEPRRFLEDAGDIVKERVRDAVERHGRVKVNTAFNGEVATKDKRANKSIITKNSEIYRCTDMREWYVTRVIEPTLASLEEFQECDSGWALSRILNLVVNVNKLNPMHAGCHFEVP